MAVQTESFLTSCARIRMPGPRHLCPFWELYMIATTKESLKAYINQAAATLTSAFLGSNLFLQRFMNLKGLVESVVRLMYHQRGFFPASCR